MANQIMEITRAERNRYGNFEGYAYDYMFPESDLVVRETIEQCYPERKFKTHEEPFVGRVFTVSQMHEVYRDLVDKAEYPDFSVWFMDMLKTHIFEEVK